MTQDASRPLELDERFPSGEWKGFWLQRPHLEGRQEMSLALSFNNGHIAGDGRDSVGDFTMKGRYDLASGKVTLNKFYTGKHHVLYEGWAESGKGIWGMWSIPAIGKDGFHLWPKGMRDPTQQRLGAKKTEPARASEKVSLEASPLP